MYQQELTLTFDALTAVLHHLQQGAAPERCVSMCTSHGNPWATCTVLPVWCAVWTLSLHASVACIVTPAGKYTIMGQLIDGMDTLDKMEKVPVGDATQRRPSSLHVSFLIGSMTAHIC